MLKTYQEVASFICKFEAGSLPKVQWTHQAHLTAGLWYSNLYDSAEALDIIRERIKCHNETVGTTNTDDSGYHETITRLYMTVIAAHISVHKNVAFDESLALLLASPLGDSAWPLRYYSRERLFSVAARRCWAEPDLQPIIDGAAPGNTRDSQPSVVGTPQDGAP